MPQPLCVQETPPPRYSQLSPSGTSCNSPTTLCGDGDMDTNEDTIYEVQPLRTYPNEDWELQDRQPPDDWIDLRERSGSEEYGIAYGECERAVKQHRRLQAAIKAHDSGSQDEASEASNSTTSATDLILGSPMPPPLRPRKRGRPARRHVPREVDSPTHRIARPTPGFNYSKLRPRNRGSKAPITAAYNPRAWHRVEKISGWKQTPSGAMVKVVWENPWVREEDTRIVALR